MGKPLLGETAPPSCPKEDCKRGEESHNPSFEKKVQTHVSERENKFFRVRQKWFLAVFPFNEIKKK